MLTRIPYAFWQGFTDAGRTTSGQSLRAERRIRTRLSEKQIDKMVEDSFPASDPPSTY